MGDNSGAVVVAVACIVIGILLGAILSFAVLVVLTLVCAVALFVWNSRTYELEGLIPAIVSGYALFAGVPMWITAIVVRWDQIWPAINPFVTGLLR